MRINPIDNRAFGSSFTNNREMWTVINDAGANYNRVFLKSAQAIVDDGKDDILELRQSSDRSMDLLVNGKLESRYIADDCILAEAGQRLIKDYAQKITGKDMEMEQLVMTPAEYGLIRTERAALDIYSGTLGDELEDEKCEDFIYETIGYAYQKLADYTRSQIYQLSQYMSAPKATTGKEK